ncbi:chemotaxis protein [Aestuariirhabdus litorea]|uniref:Chemotaxis signal transduction protein CheV n=1 Tax=Aestuariirhabdus litorea TaxID=2528527 RepID=A0A3P3VPK2_9GAMM|nr:chemotaxis protein [Aestuariirhabdus litorea]RRJ82743.1 chemotaxis signal transduction protein CheV [Aestuariirhabdus litorea]RWW92903.1 response regulator [Endozoicomonadaceae bacterium GTF-13]
MQNDRTRAEGSRQELLLFQLNGRQPFGINVLKIREIIPYEPLNQIPYSHHAVIGIAKLRGVPLTVIDLSAAVGKAPLKDAVEESASIVITEFNRSIQGFLVRKVDRIASCDWKDILPPPAASGRSSYITGVTRIGEELVEIIDVERVLNEVTPPEDIAGGYVRQLDEAHLKALQQKCILVVDDSAMARKQISRTLDTIGVPYYLARDGKEALEKLRSLSQTEGKHVDMIISDIEMPEMDGYTLTKEIRKDADLSSSYILLHTSLAGEISSQNASRSGADASLTKFVTDELTEAVIEGLSVS